MIERKRAEKGMKPLKAVGREPAYIATAADAAHRLGTNDPQRIQKVEVERGRRNGCGLPVHRRSLLLREAAAQKIKCVLCRGSA